MAQKTKDEPVVEDNLDDDPPTPAISVPETGDAGEGGKLKMIVSLVKKCLGVKDIATMCVVAPRFVGSIDNRYLLGDYHYRHRCWNLYPISNGRSTLTDPTFLLRQCIVVAVRVRNADVDLASMIPTIHLNECSLYCGLPLPKTSNTWCVAFIIVLDADVNTAQSGRVFKPYNSVLGEHFRAHWDVVPVEYKNPPIVASSSKSNSNLNVDAASVKSGKSSKSAFSAISSRKSPSTAATSLGDDALNAQMSNLNLQSNKIRIVYVTEQVSHHPPVSAYFATCPARSLELSGIDQVSAKVAGTTIKVSPGGFNKGLFIHIKDGNGKGENYQVTHPVASVNGILRGSFYITVGDTTIVSCTGGKPGSKFRAITEYKEEVHIASALCDII